MNEEHRLRDDQLPGRDADDPGAIADGDAPLTPEPPNVSNARPPGPGTAAEGGQASSGDALAALRRERDTWEDRHLRLAAEFDNYRRRVERERAEMSGRAQADLARRLLETLDDLERVGQHADTATADSLLEGIQLVERKLRSALEAAGLETVQAEGATFDPNSMEAVAMVAAEHEDEDEVVSDVFQPGYRFKGTLLRPARVRVKKHGA